MRFSRAVVLLIALALAGTGSAPADHDACFGSPPRQTPDPWSSPCVPFFEGANGGETYPGVTSERIAVVLYNDLGLSGTVGDDLTGDQELVRTVNAQFGFFSHHHQTYGREVTIEAVPSAAGVATTDSERRADAASIIAGPRPFGVLYLGAAQPTAFVETVAQARIVVFGSIPSLDRDLLTRHAPMIWTFLPDRETQVGYSAGFMCRSLSGRNARFASQQSLRNDSRRFAVIVPPDAGSILARSGALLAEEMESGCGEQIAVVPLIHESLAGLTLDLLRRRGVTTVSCYCDDRMVAAVEQAAAGLSYGPEWLWDDTTGRDDFAASSGSMAASSFGVRWKWRPPADGGYAMAAFRTSEPIDPPSADWNEVVYYSLMMLFEGVQTSGPNLQPASLERGMYTFHAVDLTNPFRPSGGFGPDYHSRATGDYSWIDTGTAWWWDPDGIGQDIGCLRMARQGRRWFRNGWPSSQGYLFDEATGPCVSDPLPQ